MIANYSVCMCVSIWSVWQLRSTQHLLFDIVFLERSADFIETIRWNDCLRCFRFAMPCPCLLRPLQTHLLRFIFFHFFFHFSYLFHSVDKQETVVTLIYCHCAQHNCRWSGNAQRATSAARTWIICLAVARKRAGACTIHRGTHSIIFSSFLSLFYCI